MHSPPAILTTCAVLACASTGLDLAHAPVLLLGEVPRSLSANGEKQWKIARECFMAMLVEHGYSVLDVVSLLDCSVHQVRKACARYRECPELQEERVIH